MQFIIKAYAVAYYKRIADWKIVSRLLPTAILGFFLAIGVDNMIPNGQFRGLMGWTLMLALAVMIWSEIFGKENKWSKKWWYAGTFGLCNSAYAATIKTGIRKEDAPTQG